MHFKNGHGYVPYITVVSQASPHSRVSAQVLVFIVRMESAHSWISVQARSLQSCMASTQAASARQHTKGHGSCPLYTPTPEKLLNQGNGSWDRPTVFVTIERYSVRSSHTHIISCHQISCHTCAHSLILSHNISSAIAWWTTAYQWCPHN